jgi:dihydropteroate synthase
MSRSSDTTPLVMGVLNVTPDSFSDGGRYLRPADAVAHGEALIAAGAAIVDVGGESTRPGATPVPLDEELRRVLPVVEALAGSVRVSIDTTKAAVAEAAVDAGATLINAVSGTLWSTAAALGTGWVAMHRRGSPADMQRDPTYADVVAEVRAALSALFERASAAGVGEIWVDPGIGFGKTKAHNLALLAELGRLVEDARTLGAAGVLVGTSRKSFLGTFADPASTDMLATDERFEGSLATAVWAMTQGVGMIRVHDVLATRRAAALVAGPLGSGATP